MGNLASTVLRLIMAYRIYYVARLSTHYISLSNAFFLTMYFVASAKITYLAYA